MLLTLHPLVLDLTSCIISKSSAAEKKLSLVADTLRYDISIMQFLDYSINNSSKIHSLRLSIVRVHESVYISTHTPIGALNNPFVLPPKRLLTTSFIPSAWIDDALIAERKAGLEEYLSNLLSIPDHENSPILAQFLTPNIVSANATRFNSVPTTPFHGAAMNVESADGVEAQNTMIAAAYYPDWSADSNPPEKIDFSKFDILFFGGLCSPSSSFK